MAPVHFFSLSLFRITVANVHSFPSLPLDERFHLLAGKWLLRIHRVPALRRLSSGVSLPKTDIREGVEEIQFHDYKHFLTDFRRKTALRVNRDGFHFDLFRAEVVGKIE